MSELAPEIAPAPVAAPAEGTEAEESRNPFAVMGYRLWWAASIVAGTGVGIQAVTVPLFIRDRVADDQRATLIAAALICQTIPGALFALIGGVVADRVERRRILIRTYGVAAAVSLAYVGLSGADVSVIWPVFILSAIVGSAGAFTNPARQSMMPQILSMAQLQNGAIFGTMAFMATVQFGGPALGGVVADHLGLTSAFGFEVVSLALAAVLFSLIATDPPVPTGKSIFRDLAQGLHHVRSHPPIFGILALGTVPGTLLMGPFMVTLVLIVQDVYHQSDTFVGLVVGSMGVGMFLGSVALSVIRLHRRGMLLCFSLVGGGLFWALYGLAPNIWVAMGVMVIAGTLGPAIFINFAVALLQENTERAMMGRVMSIYGLSFSASVPVGYAQTAAQVALWGPQTTIVVCAAITIVLGVLSMLFLKPVTRLA